MTRTSLLLVLTSAALLVACSDESEPAGPTPTGSTTSVGGGGTGGSTSSGGSGGTAGSAGGTCTEDCSGHGQCVLVDGAPTCACETGYYPVGLACLEDPCEQGGTCYYVESILGDPSEGCLCLAERKGLSSELAGHAHDLRVSRRAVLV